MFIVKKTKLVFLVHGLDHFNSQRCRLIFVQLVLWAGFEWSLIYFKIISNFTCPIEPMFCTNWNLLIISWENILEKYSIFATKSDNFHICSNSMMFSLFPSKIRMLLRQKLIQFLHFNALFWGFQMSYCKSFWHF